MSEDTFEGLRGDVASERMDAEAEELKRRYKSDGG
jgi:hypothetical protein